MASKKVIATRKAVVMPASVEFLSDKNMPILILLATRLYLSSNAYTVDPKAPIDLFDTGVDFSLLGYEEDYVDRKLKYLCNRNLLYMNKRYIGYELHASTSVTITMNCRIVERLLSTKRDFCVRLYIAAKQNSTKSLDLEYPMVSEISLLRRLGLVVNKKNRDMIEEGFSILEEYGLVTPIKVTFKGKAYYKLVNFFRN